MTTMKKRILVVEPDKHLTAGIRDILELEDYVALATTDAYAARLVVESFCPNLIMLAYSLYSEKSYGQLIHHCQHQYPIIFLCSRGASAQLQQQKLLAYEDAILEKPFDADDMLATILNLLTWQPYPR